MTSLQPNRMISMKGRTKAGLGLGLLIGGILIGRRYKKPREFNVTIVDKDGVGKVEFKGTGCIVHRDFKNKLQTKDVTEKIECDTFTLTSEATK